MKTLRVQFRRLGEGREWGFLEFCLYSSHFSRCFSCVYSLHHLQQLWENTCIRCLFQNKKLQGLEKQRNLHIRSHTCKWQNQIGISDCLDLGKSSLPIPAVSCLEFRGKCWLCSALCIHSRGGHSVLQFTWSLSSQQGSACVWAFLFFPTEEAEFP